VASGIEVTYPLLERGTSIFGANVEIDGTEATRGGGAADTDALVSTAGITDAADSIRPTTFGRLAGNGANWLGEVGLVDNGDGRINSTSRGI
jgi:hypothetical protein